MRSNARAGCSGFGIKAMARYLGVPVSVVREALRKSKKQRGEGQEADSE